MPHVHEINVVLAVFLVVAAVALFFPSAVFFERWPSFDIVFFPQALSTRLNQPAGEEWVYHADWVKWRLT